MDSVAAALRTIQIEALASRGLSWSALIVPLLAALVVWLRRSHLPHPQRGLRTAGTLALWSSYSFVALFFVSCFIGDTGKRQLGRALAAPVLSALQQYHAASGVYPDSLLQLVPTYLAPSALHPSEQRLLNGPLRYVRDSGGFTLSFSYLGPGANTCNISPKGRWSCGGLY